MQIPTLTQIRAAIDALPSGTRSAISRHLGIAEGTLSKWLSGDRKISLDDTARLIKTLNALEAGTLTLDVRPRGRAKGRIPQPMPTAAKAPSETQAGAG